MAENNDNQETIKWYEIYDVLANLLIAFYKKIENEEVGQKSEEEKDFKGENVGQKLCNLLGKDEDFKEKNGWFYDKKAKELKLTKIDPKFEPKL